MASLFGRGRRQRAVLAAVTAAASRFDAESKEETAYLKRLEKWQERAWFFYGTVPEVGYAARYFANGLSRIRLVPALRIPESTDPVPLVLDGDRELGYTSQEAEACHESLARLRSPQGGQSEIMRRFGLNLFAPGDSLLFGRDDPEWGGERWDVYSTSQLTLDSAAQNWELHEPPSSGVKVTQRAGAVGKVRATFSRDDVVVIRIWRSHPQFDTWADSPMRASEMILDELLVLTKAINAVATSRLAGPGIMFLPSSLRDRFGPDSADAQVSDRFIVDLVESTAKTIADPGLASAQVPNFIFVPDNLYEQVGSDKLVQWSRDLDEIMERQRESLLTRWASVIDAPQEVMKGIGDMSHWNAWQIPEEAFRAHYAPAALTITEGLTSRFHWPYLRERGIRDEERFVVWYDAARLVAPPDQSKNYLEAYDRLEVSGEAYRKALGIGEDEAPDEDEVARRIVRAQALRPSASSGGQPAPPTPMPPGARRQAILAPPAALVAAAGDPEDEALAALPGTLGAMDAALLTALLGAADSAMRRALERANQRVRTLASRDSTLRGVIATARADELEVAPILGQATVESLAAVDELLVGAFDRLGSDYMRRVGRAGEEAVRLAAAAGDLSEAEARRMLELLDEEREQSWGLLLGLLLALAGERLYRPHPSEEPGEITDHLVPPGVVREALIRAGGGAGTSMLTGQLVEELFRRAGVGFEGFVWRYGDPSARRTVFEPHREIDGLGAREGEDPITGPEDPRLVMASWPYSRWPLDHRGCLCALERARAVRIGAEAPTIREAQEVA